MCRVLSYLGIPIVLEDLLYNPDNSFIKQSYHPKYMSYILNLAGFGMVAWDQQSNEPLLPYIYKTDQLPFYDQNLRNLTKKLKPGCLLTHIRGVAYFEKKPISNQNVHPFIFEPSNIALAHNGSLYDFDKMKYDLLPYIKPEYQMQIHGTTDSEWLYAVFLSQIPDPQGHYSPNEIYEFIIKTLKILKNVRYKHNIRVNSPVNLFITNGEFIAATRFVFDYGWLPLDIEKEHMEHFAYHSLWYTYGESYELSENEYKMKGGDKRSSILIASEPLTEDTTTWIELPEYTCIVARLQKDNVEIVTHDIHL